MEDDNQTAVSETLRDLEQALKASQHKLVNEEQKNWALKALLEALWCATDETQRSHDVRYKVAQILFPHWFPTDCLMPGLILGGLAIGEYVVL